MTKKAGRKQGAAKRKQASTLKDLSLGSKRGDKAGAVKGGTRKRPICIAG